MLFDGRAVTSVLCLHGANGDVDGWVFDGDHVSGPAHRGNLRKTGSSCQEKWVEKVTWRYVETGGSDTGNSCRAIHLRFLLFR